MLGLPIVDLLGCQFAIGSLSLIIRFLFAQINENVQK